MSEAGHRAGREGEMSNINDYYMHVVTKQHTAELHARAAQDRLAKEYLRAKRDRRRAERALHRKSHPSWLRALIGGPNAAPIESPAAQPTDSEAASSGNQVLETVPRSRPAAEREEVAC
jgi:hypothetical protein